MGNSSQKVVCYNDPTHLKKINNRSKGEKMTRLILESLFNKSFITERPDFLNYIDKKKAKGVKKITNTNKNKINKINKSNNLEIDLYNAELKLGIEYQGDQHFKYNTYFHKTKDGYIRSMDKDHFKRKKCYQNGIYLIEIHDFLKEEDLGRYVLDSLPSRLVDHIDLKRKKLLLEGKVFLLNP